MYIWAFSAFRARLLDDARKLSKKGCARRGWVEGESNEALRILAQKLFIKIGTVQASVVVVHRPFVCEPYSSAQGV